MASRSQLELASPLVGYHSIRICRLVCSTVNVNDSYVEDENRDASNFCIITHQLVIFKTRRWKRRGIPSSSSLLFPSSVQYFSRQQ